MSATASAAVTARPAQFIVYPAEFSRARIVHCKRRRIVRPASAGPAAGVRTPSREARITAHGEAETGGVLAGGGVFVGARSLLRRDAGKEHGYGSA